MAKKDFSSNPALQFISTPVKPSEAAPIERKGSSQERKTKRLNLLIQPSTLERLTKIAHMKVTSVNDLINTVLKEYVDTEHEAVAKYDAVFKEGK